MQSDNLGDGGRTAAGLTRRQALVDVVLAVVLTLAGGIIAPLVGSLLMQALGWPLLAVLVIQGLIVLAGLQVLLAWRGHGWRQIGFLPLQLRDLGRALLALLVVFDVNALLSLAAMQVVPEIMQAHQERLSGFAALLAGDLSLIAVAVVTLFIGFYEEVLARGFLLDRSRTLLPGIWGPVLLSSLLFGLGHFYQGWFGVMQTAIIGIVFARLVLHWGTLWPAILAHAALNTLSLAAFRALEDVS